MLRKVLPNKEYLKIFFKLLHDMLFTSLVFFLLALIAEGILPGIITGHVEFSQIIIFIFIVIFAIYVLGNFLKISFTGDERRINKKTACLLLFVLVLLIFNSLLKLNIFLNLLIVISIIFLGYFTYKTLLEEN